VVVEQRPPNGSFLRGWRREAGACTYALGVVLEAEFVLAGWSSSRVREGERPVGHAREAHVVVVVQKSEVVTVGGGDAVVVEEVVQYTAGMVAHVVDGRPVVQWHFSGCERCNEKRWLFMHAAKGT